jgi:hypothetical protein
VFVGGTQNCRGELPRTIAHIGFLFSDLVDAGQLSFFGAR